jgi:hypothetical protein
MIHDGKGGNLGGLAVIVCIFTAGLSFLLFIGLRKIFKEKVWWQSITELLLISIVVFFFYKQNGKLVLQVPRHFQGYLFVVYGVDSKPTLQKTSFLKANIDVTVPNSGIIFTSSKRFGTIAIADGSIGEAKTVGDEYIIPFAWDALKCGTKKYFMDVLVFGPLSTGWNYRKDYVNRNLKKDSSCKMLTR